MSDREYTTVDKADWGPGSWQHEPDKQSWTDETTGMPCLIVRNHSGALCGYVGVNPDHPWHGIGYGSCTVSDCSEEWCYEHTPEGVVTVHSGLTFAAGCSHDEDEATGICHIPDPGQTNDVWWFGFDCNHAHDLAPGSQQFYRDKGLSIPDEVYRDVVYVRAEVAALAQQLAEVVS